MPTSEEVLASPPPRRRPLARAGVTVLVVGLVAWGAVAKLGGDGGSETPAAAPPHSAPSARSSPNPTAIPPPPWVRYPSPLEGRWVGDGGSGRVTLVVSNARLSLWEGTGPQTASHVLGLRTITVNGHRVHVRPTGHLGEPATYRWRIRRDHLTFELVGRTPNAALRLERLRFLRVS